MGCGGPRPVSTHEVAVEIALFAHAASSNLTWVVSSHSTSWCRDRLTTRLPDRDAVWSPQTTFIECGMRQYRTEPSMGSSTCSGNLVTFSLLPIAETKVSRDRCRYRPGLESPLRDVNHFWAKDLGWQRCAIMPPWQARETLSIIWPQALCSLSKIDHSGGAISGGLVGFD